MHEEQRDKIGPLSGEDIDQSLPEKYERPTPRGGSMPQRQFSNNSDGVLSPVNLAQSPLEKQHRIQKDGG